MLATPLYYDATSEIGRTLMELQLFLSYAMHIRYVSCMMGSTRCTDCSQIQPQSAPRQDG